MNDTPMTAAFGLDPSGIRKIFTQLSHELRQSLSNVVYFYDTVDGVRGCVAGQTSFFRHEDMFTPLLASLPAREWRILAAPSSVGCEAYTLSAMAMAANVTASIDALDISPRFTALARAGIYPREMTTSLDDDQRAMLFEGTNRADMLRIRDDVAAHVRFMEPQCLERFEPTHGYDVVIANNIFTYMTADQMRSTVAMVDRSGADLFIFRDEDARGERVAYHAPPPEHFVDIEHHPVWRDTPLAAYAVQCGQYGMWARLRR